ncbi:MAG: right-handed parallel beta-helix repeat-containing protein [Nannocystaceae bacterium]
MHLGLIRWSTTIAVLCLGSPGCNVEPQGGNGGASMQACGELQGDFTCQSIYTGRPYCSLCTEVLQGCVVTIPVAVCRPDAGTGDTTDDGMGTTGDSGSTGETTVVLDGSGDDTSTGEPPCEADGRLDPGCEQLDPLRPFCVDAACVGCEAAGGDAFCGDLDLTTPACNSAVGTCEPCDVAARPVCGDATPVCGPEGACQACVAHDECPDSACHLGSDDPLLGSCFAADEVVWVDNTASCPGLGSLEEPLCSLTAATEGLAVGDSRVIRIAGGGGPYPERVVFDGELTVALIGTADPIISGAVGQQAATMAFDEGVTAYVDGLGISGNALTHGILCNSSTVVVEDSTLRNNDGWGIFDFEPCTLDLRRTVIVGNEDGGVRLNGGQLTLSNVSVGLNGVGGNSTGLRVQDGNVDILYSTIAGNDGSGADSLECDGATGSIRNSIVVGVDPFSIELDCFPLVMEHNALDAGNFASGTNLEVPPYSAIFFNDPVQGDFTLSAPPLTPYLDLALWQPGDPPLDADGTPRPQGGQLGYAGVDEP